MKIFLDDDPIRDSWVDDTWTIVRRPCITLMHCIEDDVEELSLDHDLGLSYATGYTVVERLELWASKDFWDRIPNKITIHSANPVGRKNMQAAIDSIERMRNEARRKLRNLCESDTCQGCEYCAMLQSNERMRNAT